jgi:hypothetical protein
LIERGHFLFVTLTLEYIFIPHNARALRRRHTIAVKPSLESSRQQASSSSR